MELYHEAMTLLTSGSESETDSRRALDLLAQAAAQDYPRAVAALGHCEARPFGGVRHNLASAAQRLCRAAFDAGDPLAVLLLRLTLDSLPGVRAPTSDECHSAYETLSRELAASESTHPDPLLQSVLACCWLEGIACEADVPRAMAALTDLGNRGFAPAGFVLGQLYHTGRIPAAAARDAAEAVRWLLPAAKQGHALAQNMLGYLYEQGKGVPSADGAEAVRLYRAAAEQGLPFAQYNLAACYHTGQGVPQDQQAALHWLRQSAEQGYALAQYRLGSLYRAGQGLPQDTPTALHWLRLAAAQQNARAENLLGYMYRHGEGVPRDEREAVRLYRLAAQRGLVDAQYNLAQCLQHGVGCRKDGTEAAKWYQLAAAQGDQASADELRKLNASAPEASTDAPRKQA